MSDDAPETTEAKLRRQIAEHEAKAEALKVKLEARLAKQRGEKPPVTGLDLLWKAAPEMARKRSSPQLCRIAWNKLPMKDRPKIADMVAAMEAWAKDPEWKKDGGQFVPALDRWIKEMRWEDPPAPPNPMARYQTLPKPALKPSTETLTDRDEIRSLLGLKPQNPASE